MARVWTGTTRGHPAATVRSPAGEMPHPAPAARANLPRLATADNRGRGREWDRRWRAVLVAADAVGVAAALAVADAVRFGVGPVSAGVRLPYLAVAGGVAVAWLAVLAAGGCYEVRHLGVGVEEYKRVAEATFRLWAVVGLASYATKAELARGFVLVAMPLGLVALLCGRAVARRSLVLRRRRGRMLHRVVVVGGDRASAVELSERLAREPAAGLEVVGLCVAPRGAHRARAAGPPLVGTLDNVPDVVRAYRADMVAVAAPHVGPDVVRRIAWGLEGSGVDLVVAPAVAAVAGPRVSVRPVAGLPLLHVDEPEFTGCRRLVKDLLDRVVAALGLLLLAPLFCAVAVAVRLSSPGPALFRQRRVGRDGREFQVLKFRTMTRDADRQQPALADRNESDGLLFKLRDDPRVTRLGALLRRTSLDELPQLVNVLRGEMSLVGPRPLPVRESDFRGDARRRLLVKPGITGLWQVSGRSRLSWEDAVRLDLYYVENWSISLDLAILARTVGAVLRGTGAY
jgi:exopolysaccharide biosynthesis polyprenyl glycosylphosphotransferase